MGARGPWSCAPFRPIEAPPKERTAGMVRASREPPHRRSAPGPRPGDLRLRGRRRDRGPGTRVLARHSDRPPRAARAARPAPDPHPPRPRGRDRRPLPALPEAQGVRARGGRAAPGGPLEAPEERGAALRGRHVGALGRGGAGARGAHHRRQGRRDGRGLSRGLHARARHPPRLLPARGHWRRVRRRRGGRTHPALRPYDRAHAAARHRRRGLARLAPHARRLEPPVARADPLRARDRGGRPPPPHEDRPAGAGRLGAPRRRGDLHRAPRGAARRRHRPRHRGVLRAGGPAEPALHGPRALLAQARRMSQTVELPRVGGPGSGLEDNWRVIVLNDNHNTFEGVAFALSSTLPGVSYDDGMAMANTIHNKGQAIVWTGAREPAELYWEQLKDTGLTMAPLEQG